jgi:hypothetical protein
MEQKITQKFYKKMINNREGRKGGETISLYKTYLDGKFLCLSAYRKFHGIKGKSFLVESGALPLAKAEKQIKRYFRVENKLKEVV